MVVLVNIILAYADDIVTLDNARQDIAQSMSTKKKLMLWFSLGETEISVIYNSRQFYIGKSTCYS